MMHDPAAHLDAGVLLAWLDDSLDPVERADADHHLAACAACRAELAALTDAAARVSGMLATITPEVDVPAFRGTERSALPLSRRHPSRAAWRLAAAVIIGAATLALAGEPLLAFARSVWTRLSPPAPAPVAPEARADSPARDQRELVRMVVPGPELTLDFATPPEAGALTVRRGTDGMVVVTITDSAGASDTGVLVLPGSVLRVRNARVPRSDFGVSVPAAFERVIVTVGGREVARLDSAGIVRSRPIQLAR